MGIPRTEFATQWWFKKKVVRFSPYPPFFQKKVVIFEPPSPQINNCNVFFLIYIKIAYYRLNFIKRMKIYFLKRQYRNFKLNTNINCRFRIVNS